MVKRAAEAVVRLQEDSPRNRGLVLWGGNKEETGNYVNLQIEL